MCYNLSQIPQWMEDDQQTQSLEEQRVTPSSSDSSSQESHMAHLKRTRNPITSDSSSSSSSEKTTWISMSKRQRISGTPISPDVIEVCVLITCTTSVCLIICVICLTCT